MSQSWLPQNSHPRAEPDIKQYSNNTTTCVIKTVVSAMRGKHSMLENTLQQSWLALGRVWCYLQKPPWGSDIRLEPERMNRNWPPVTGGVGDVLQRRKPRIWRLWGRKGLRNLRNREKAHVAALKWTRRGVQEVEAGEFGSGPTEHSPAGLSTDAGLQVRWSPSPF